MAAAIALNPPAKSQDQKPAPEKPEAGLQTPTPDQIAKAAADDLGGDDAELAAAFGEKLPDKPKPVARVETKADDKAKEPDKKVEPPKEEAKKDEPKKDEPKPETFRDSKEMREAIKRRDTQISTLQSERDKATHEAAELKAKIEKGEVGGDAKAMAEQLTAKEKELTDLRATLAQADYRKHPDFEKQFIKPYSAIKQRAQRDITSLTVATEGGQTRPATANDLEALLRLPRVEAMRIALKAFGDDAPIITEPLGKLYDIHENAEAAIQEHRTTYEERNRTQIAEQRRQMEELNKVRQVIIDEKRKSVPDFSPAEGDDEGNTLLDQGMQWMAKVTGDSTMPPQERIQSEAELWFRGAAFPKVQKQRDFYRDQVKAVTAEKDTKIAELEKRITELTESGPGPSRRQGEVGEKPKDPDQYTAQEAGFDR